MQTLGVSGSAEYTPRNVVAFVVDAQACKIHEGYSVHLGRSKDISNATTRTYPLDHRSIIYFTFVANMTSV